MKWMLMDAPIPLDEHRWIILYARNYHRSNSLETLLNSAGFEVTVIQEFQGSAPELKGYKPFYGLIEPQITRMTPEMLKEQIYSPALLVSEDPISAVMEIALDSQELLIGDHIVPTRFLKDEEKALAGSWYMASAIWSTQAPSIAEINKVFRAKGYQAHRPDSFPLSAKVETQQFLFSPGQRSPRLREIKALLKADALYINSFPFEGDVDWMRQIEGKGDEFLKAITSFGAETLDVVKSVADVGTQAGKTVKQALGALEIGLMVAVPLGLLGLGFWAYSKYQDTGGRA